MLWFLGPKIAFGEGALDYLEEIKAKRAIIVTDDGITKIGLHRIITERLEKAAIPFTVYDGVEREPSFENIEKGATLLHTYQPDLIIALGGGSCMDAVKGMWARYERPDLDLREVTPLIELGLGAKARVINVPTTTATAAVSWAAVISNHEAHRKMEIASREFFADVTILDPEMVRTSPPRQTGDSGMDVLADAVEAYVSAWRNDFSAAAGLEATRLILAYLPRAYRNGNDLEAREKTLNAAALCGLALSSSQIGIANAMAHAFGPVFNMPHGRCSGLFLPYAIEYCAATQPGIHVQLARGLGVDGGSDAEVAARLDQAVKRVMQEVEQPLAVKEMGVSRTEYEKRLDFMADNAGKDIGALASPREPSFEDLRRLFTYAYEGRVVDF